MEVRPGGRLPASVADVPVERVEALLPVAVDVVREGIAGLLDGPEERLEQGARRGPALQAEGTAVTPVRIVRRGRQAVLHALEVRQAVGVVPALHPGIGRPALVVEGVAALEDHPVDAARAAEHLAPGVVDPSAVHERLGLRLVLPVVEPAADRERQGRRHVDEDVPRIVRPAGLEDEDARRRVRAQAIRERAACRTAADDDEVVPGVCHSRDASSGEWGARGRRARRQAARPGASSPASRPRTHRPGSRAASATSRPRRTGAART